MLHANDPATGEIKQIWGGGIDEQNRLEVKGYIVVEGPNVSASSHNYLRGELAPKIPVSLISNKPIFSADGADEIVVVVTVAAEDPPASIEVLVADTVQMVELTAGVGQTLPITAPYPTTIEVRVADPVAYLDNGGCMITAQETQAMEAEDGK